jgi:HK97 family phage major capsid protein
MELQELFNKRAELVNQARAIIDRATKQKRDIVGEEEHQYDQIMGQVTSFSTDIDQRQRLETVENAVNRDLVRYGARGPQSEWRSRGMVSALERGQNSFQQSLWKQLFPYAQDLYRSAFHDWMVRGNKIEKDELRVLQVGSGVLGGYLVMPTQLVDRVLAAMDNLVYIRQWGTVFAVPMADSLGVPALDSDLADPTWTTELFIGSEDSSLTLGKRELHPHPLAEYIKISNRLMRMVPNVESFVVQRMAYKFGVVQENSAMNGKGAGEWLGVFTASESGIPTSRDVSTGNTATSIQFDGLIEAKYTLKSQYWPNARWIFHPSAGKQIAKLQDDAGQYIWRESVRVGEPDRLLGIPDYMSEYAPSTFTTGQYVGVLGDFSYYWIADSLDMEMQRLVELFAANNQLGLIGRLESDGMPALGEAFVRIKLG